MANCSIPNSIPGSGRISTRLSRRSRRRNRGSRDSVLIIHRPELGVEKRRPVAAYQGALRARRIRSAMCSLQFAIRRVKGAWWPSRSSKPSLPRKWRGRFDSYPLRLFVFNFQFAIADCSRIRSEFFNRKSQFEIQNRVKGGEPHVA